MDIYLHKFSKRDNSTLQPTGTGTKYTVTLKEPTSLTNPVITITGNNFSSYNYAYIPDFGRYYFITGINSNSMGITQLSLKEDHGASWKTAIGNTAAYIAYSSTGYNKDITDPRIVTHTTKTTRKSTAVDPGWFSQAGCYVFSIIGNSSSINGFATSFIMDQLELGVVCSNLMSLKIEDRVIKAIYSPFDCVISCTWIPIDYNTAIGHTVSSPIYFGDWDSGLTGHRLTSSVMATQATMTFTPRYNDFRSIQPYTSYALYLPMFGIVDLNASDIRDAIDNTNLAVGIAVDIASGDVSIHIGNPVVQTLQYNIGVNCPIAQTSTNMTGAIGGAAGTVGGIAATVGLVATGNVAGAIGSAAVTLASGANTALQFNARSTSIKGGISGRSIAAWGTTFYLIEYSIDTENPSSTNYIAKFGRPVGHVGTISSYSGYVQCENASVDMDGLEDERSVLNNLLNTGFYYE